MVDDHVVKRLGTFFGQVQIGHVSAAVQSCCEQTHQVVKQRKLQLMSDLAAVCYTTAAAAAAADR